jgi:hypothetical protein
VGDVCVENLWSTKAIVRYPDLKMIILRVDFLESILMTYVLYWCRHFSRLEQTIGERLREI